MTVTDNLVEHNAGGILLSDETGPKHDNLIARNTLKDNIYDCGLTLPTHTTTNGVYGNTVEDNTVTGNGTSMPGISGRDCRAMPRQEADASCWSGCRLSTAPNSAEDFGPLISESDRNRGARFNMRRGWYRESHSRNATVASREQRGEQST